jgi:hypothetical protein
MDTIPNLRWPPRLARLYSEDVRRLEALHADRISPGTRTWADAVEALFQRMYNAGPVKGTLLIRKAIDYLNSIDGDQRSHFMIAASCRTRTTVLLFATFSTGAHPDPNVKESGLSIVLHAIHYSRRRAARVADVPVGYVSMHALRRLFERGYDITGNSHASSIFTFVGALGYLTHKSEKHVDGGLNLLFTDTLVTGSQHRCAKTYPNGRQFEDAFFDVRTVLDASDIGPGKQSLKDQGRIAAAVVAEWLEREDGLLHRELVERIPRLERREDIYPLRQMEKTR